ncbi:imm11 family protein [Malaciobacter molluscorum]|uniref:imm11 family protein n=1 Tax=Malaciobacter molluscorum TaxID=1032072 RepID=UPI003916FBA8
MGPLLISKNFIDIFSHLISSDIKLFKAVIVDNEGNSNNDFYMMIILNHLSCMDDIKSVVEEKVFRDDSKSIRIKKLSINADKTDNKSVFLVKEKTSYSIVNEDFKNRGNKLNGLNFLKIS